MASTKEYADFILEQLKYCFREVGGINGDFFLERCNQKFCIFANKFITNETQL
jgi:hypothetical protein